jgi:hemerythrin
MSIFKYPDVISHKGEHQAFIAKLFELAGEINTGKKAVNRELSDFLWSWFQDHILVIDKKYSDALLATGMD